MIVIRTVEEASTLSDPELRALIFERIETVTDGEPYDSETYGIYILMEPGDSLEALTGTMGFSVLECRFTGRSLGEPDFEPCAEWIEELPLYYDLSYVVGDAGYGVNLFVPKGENLPDKLVKLCTQFATPAPDCS